MISVVVVYDRETSTTLSAEQFDDNPGALARVARLRLEIKYRENPNIEVVLVRGSNLDDLKRSHARYFAPETISPSRFDDLSEKLRRRTA